MKPSKINQKLQAHQNKNHNVGSSTNNVSKIITSQVSTHLTDTVNARSSVPSVLDLDHEEKVLDTVMASDGDIADHEGEKLDNHFDHMAYDT